MNTEVRNLEVRHNNTEESVHYNAKKYYDDFTLHRTSRSAHSSQQHDVMIERRNRTYSNKNKQFNYKLRF